MQARYLMFFRALLAGTLLLYSLHGPGAALARGWVWALFAAHLGVAGGAFWLGRTKRLPDSALLFFFVLDVAITSAVLYINEGFHNEFYVAYFLVILSTCFLEKLSFSLIVGAAAFLVYAYFAYPAAGELQPFYLLRSSLLLVTAFFSSYVADGARRMEREASDRYSDQLAWLQRLSIVGRAMAAVLHEARTPLSTIVLAAEQARAHAAAGESMAASLETIEQEAERTVTILGNFLDLARPRPLELVSLELTEPLKRALDAVRVHAHDREVRVESDFGPPARVMGSERHLVQALTNLMLNAVQAMPLGGTLAVRARVEDGRALVEVADTGMGMDAETLKRLEEPFFTGKPKDGHGLGLTVVRWVMERHGGHLVARSDGPNLGSVFSISLPLSS